MLGAADSSDHCVRFPQYRVCGSRLAVTHKELSGCSALLRRSAMSHSCSSVPAVSLWWFTHMRAARFCSAHTVQNTGVRITKDM